MKPKSQIAKMAYANPGFTIIELLTVMSIIVILLSLLLPSMNMVRWYAKFVTQKNQLRNIDSGLQAFEIDYKEYPDSSATDGTGASYCGAMKLAEAMAGQDGLGFNPNSTFTADDGSGATELYPPPPGSLPLPTAYEDNLRNRKEYIEPKDVRIYTLNDIYGSGNSGGFTPPDEIALLCDVYRTVRHKSTGKRIGTPILYYRADPTKLVNDSNNPDNIANIYNYRDNQELLALGLPDNTALRCPLYESDGTQGRLFYEKIQDKSALPIERPFNKDGYILMSAGKDGLYGTRDDVTNFAE